MVKVGIIKVVAFDMIRQHFVNEPWNVIIQIKGAIKQYIVSIIYIQRIFGDRSGPIFIDEVSISSFILLFGNFDINFQHRMFNNFPKITTTHVVILHLVELKREKVSGSEVNFLF